MQLKQRIKKLENSVHIVDDLCPQTCRKHPEIIISHQSNGVDIPPPDYWAKQSTEPILEICGVCHKPTRKQGVILNWIDGEIGK